MIQTARPARRSTPRLASLGRARSGATIARTLALACALASSLCVARANAQTAPTESEESAAYIESVEGALEEYRVGHYDEARSLFERAHELEPSARTLRGLGMVEFELRHYVRAVELIERSLASPVKPLTDEQRSALSELLARARRFVARYALRVTPTPTRIELDGVARTLEPDGRLTVDAGEHRLELAADGYAPSSLTLDAKGGTESELTVALRPLAKPELVASAAPSSEHPHRKLGIALTAAGSVTIAAGVTLYALALGKANSASARDDSEADAARTLAPIGDALLGVGVATAISGVVLLLWRRERPVSAAQARLEAVAPQLRVRF